MSAICRAPRRHHRRQTLAGGDRAGRRAARCGAVGLAPADAARGVRTTATTANLALPQAESATSTRFVATPASGANRLQTHCACCSQQLEQRPSARQRSSLCSALSTSSGTEEDILTRRAGRKAQAMFELPLRIRRLTCASMRRMVGEPRCW